MNDAERGSGQGAEASPACQEVREHLPLLVAHRSAGPGARSGFRPDARMQAHLQACASCAEEYRFLERLARARPAPPSDLAARVVAQALLTTPQPSAAVESDVLPFRPPTRRSTPVRWWTSPAAAAAVVVLAAGLGLVARGVTAGLDGNGTVAAFDATTSADWMTEEWMVAGAPYLESVSDETLALLAAGIEP
jgi:predicted anti-sigma-YlaC factor YlaD